MWACLMNLHLEIKHSSRLRQPLVQCQQSNIGFKGEAKNVLLGAGSGPCSSFIVPKWTTYCGALVIALTAATCQTQQAKSKGYLLRSKFECQMFLYPCFFIFAASCQAIYLQLYYKEARGLIFLKMLKQT